MDTLAHSLWTLIAFFNHPRKYLAILIGVLPDVVSFIPHFVVEHLVNRNAGHILFDSIYKLTHSLVIFAIVIGLIYLMTKKFYWISLAWPLHIVIDMFTHTFEYYPTPYLYPLSSPFIFAVDYRGMAFNVINYLLIFLVFGVLIYLMRKETSIRKAFK
jgi:hypothetical protein